MEVTMLTFQVHRTYIVLFFTTTVRNSRSQVRFRIHTLGGGIAPQHCLHNTINEYQEDEEVVLL